MGSIIAITLLLLCGLTLSLVVGFFQYFVHRVHLSLFFIGAYVLCYFIISDFYLFSISTFFAFSLIGSLLGKYVRYIKNLADKKIENLKEKQ
ncbi:hypothetical protein [Priestia taiwanensis]|uniref:Uncharacterized protein n=1 Tax=Priestia taiwanensis TaxID=1347902 RepID=A0A917AVI0_9BACI|nr:hypothetical protein [Priestia taiwanensis]MBM7364770.1 putative membrane protein [Priestia taiwanensis]GGE79471.1 hypothetical protein GCM10007140_31340 [Priestia taiwanensis]